jgi:hypothetical protein
VADFNTTQPFSFLIATTDFSMSQLDDKYSINPGDFDVSNFTGYTPAVAAVWDIEVAAGPTTAPGSEFINFTPVPEPGTLLATGAVAVIGLAGMICRREAAAARVSKIG